MDGKAVGGVGNDGPSRVDYVQSMANRSSQKGNYAGWKPVASADFDQNYEPISPTNPGPVATSYTVRNGDTLQSIARTVWGDSAMWYLIADANGLASGSTLSANMVLIIPNKVTNIHNNAGTFRPYNPGEAIGDTSPTLPVAPSPPKKKKKCGGIGAIIAAVVSVVATYVLGPIGGNIVSQVFNNVIGIQKGFSFSNFAMSVVQQFGGLPQVKLGSDILTKAANAAISNVASQGLSIITGQQKGFSWSSVAVSAIAAPLVSKVNEKLLGGSTPLLGSIASNPIAAQTVAGFVSSGVQELTRVAIQGGRINWVGIASSTAQAFTSAALTSAIAQQRAVQGNTTAVAQKEDSAQALYNANLAYAQNNASVGGVLSTSTNQGGLTATNGKAVFEGYVTKNSAGYSGMIDTSDGLSIVGIKRNGDPNGIVKGSGTYIVEKVSDEWMVTRATTSVETDKAAINGILNEPGYAAWLMGQHIEAEFKNVDKFTLFYNPTEGLVADGWESLRDKMGLTTDIAKQFSKVLVETQASGRNVDWVAHSQGGIIFSEAVRISDSNLSNMSVVFHSGGNNEWVTNKILDRAEISLIGEGYRNHPLDPVPNIAGFNTANPIKIIGSIFALPFVIWGGSDVSPHTLPHIKNGE